MPSSNGPRRRGIGALRDQVRDGDDDAADDAHPAERTQRRAREAGRHRMSPPFDLRTAAPCRTARGAPTPAGRLVADLWPHPVTAAGRETRVLAPPAEATVADVLALALPVPPAEVAHCVAVALDGRPLAAADWARTPAAGHALVVRAAAAGGDDSDPLRILLTIGVAAASIAVPGLPALAGTAFAAGTLGGAALSAGILVGGSLVVNALAPPPAPPTLAGPVPADEVWSLAAGQNRARAWEPMRLVLGSHRLFPDLCGREYTEFAPFGANYLI